MDPLTHTATGVLLARAGLDRFTPRATLICVVAANIPDIDIVTASSSTHYLNYHRHLTHGLAAVPFMGALAVLIAEGLARLFRQRGEPLPWLSAWAVATLVALSHPLLDLMNAYGIRLALPFSGAWQSLDILFVIEPIIWLILSIAIVAPMLAGLLHSEIGDQPPRRDRWAWAGLTLVLAFMGVKGVLHARAVDTLDAHLYDGAPAVRVAAFPMPFNPLTWLAYVETERSHYFSTLNLSEEYDPSRAKRYYKPEPGPALEAAYSGSLVGDYRDFAQYAFTEVEPIPGGHLVRMADFRFPRGDGFGFQCRIQLDELNQVVREQFRFGGD
jgi:inner membrane protein